MRKVGVLGASGRMGRVLTKLVSEADDLALAGAVVRSGSEHKLSGEDLPVTTDIQAVAKQSDVLIDFSLPAALDAHLSAAEAAATPIVIGTTGLDSEGLARIDAAAASTPVVYAANYSSGVTLLQRLAALTAAALDEDFDVEILEAHHRNKQDAPSGTALALGESVARGRDIQLDDQAVYCREGITGARSRGSIGFQAQRGGDIIGEHTVLFAGDGERVELTHRASSRETFARGALRAGRWLIGQPPGRYDMEDVLGLKD